MWELVQDGEKSKCWLNLDEIGKRRNSQFDWKNSTGKKIGVRYQWFYDEVEEKWFLINDYSMESQYLFLIDENMKEFRIGTGNLCKGRLGKIFNKLTNEFMYNIGDEINGLKIINREYRKNEKGQNFKWYQYQCLKCGNIDWKIESSLKNNTGCNVCGKVSKKVLKGVNDIATTHPHLCKYFVNKEDIYIYSCHSGKKVFLKCPDCGCQKKMNICNLTDYGFSCSKCSDSISYPEKFIINILKQLNINFQTQLSKTTFDWCCDFRYDFYLLDFNIIIEAHGIQHYKNNGGVFADTYEKQHKIDMLKYDIAVLNEFEANKNYFVIDCRYSNLEWMKKHIIEVLGNVFDLSNIDWKKADLESQKSHMILACQLKKENPDLFTSEIVNLIKKEIGVEYCTLTIMRWLKKGNELGLCHYDSKEESVRNGKKYRGENHPMYGKHHSDKTRRKISKNHPNVSGENSPSAKLIDRYDLQMNYIDTNYGFNYVKLYNFNAGHISSCCTRKRKQHKGYIFRYHTD